jgi:hypothetical protein
MPHGSLSVTVDHYTLGPLHNIISQLPPYYVLLCLDGSLVGYHQSVMGHLECSRLLVWHIVLGCLNAV